MDAENCIGCAVTRCNVTDWSGCPNHVGGGGDAWRVAAGVTLSTSVRPVVA
jgi:hypothetical protein